MLHLIRHYLLDVNKESRLSSDVLVKALRQIYQRCIDMPAYTVAAPRPRKPPLSKTLVHCQNRTHCVAGPPVSRDPSTIISRTKSALVAPSPILSQRNTSYRQFTIMASDRGVPGPSQWLDDFISHHISNSDPRPNLVGFTQENPAPHNMFQVESSQEAHFTAPSPIETRSGQRRGFNSVTGSSHGDSHDRVKRRKREGALPQSAQETTSHPPKDYSPSGTTKSFFNPPRPPAAASKSKMFACPFSKRVGERQVTTKDWKCCLGSGPGWTIHRLK